MSVEFIDQTGKPRSTESLKEALTVVEREIVAFRAEPTLLVQLPVIREALLELIYIRGKLEEIRATRQQRKEVSL